MKHLVYIFCLIGIVPSSGFAKSKDHPADHIDSRVMGKAMSRSTSDIPASVFKKQLLALPPTERALALKQYNGLRVPDKDSASLRVSRDGSMHYSCFHDVESMPLPLAAEAPLPTDTITASAAVPVTEPPVFHSKPGAANVIYLDFNGGVISGQNWNSTYNSGNDYDAYVWSSDSDYTTFSDSEQNTIRRIWQRISEDYAPFDVNVTTDTAYDPNTTGGLNNVLWLLFTRDEDKNNASMPEKGAGGVAYLNVFGLSNYASNYQPALVYSDNLSNSERFMAAAASHEAGHNFGLSHDGTTTVEYYAGHGSGETSWDALMGAAYYSNVTTWSKGEYYNANNLEDDLAIISAKLSYRADDHGNATSSATPLVFLGNGIENVTTNSFIGDDNNEGIIQSTTDVDYFSFQTTGGSVSITIKPFVAEVFNADRGTNLDILLNLYDSVGALVVSANPSTTAATISTSLAPGDYFLSVEGTGFGNPLNSSPTGYTEYGSLGMFFISGSIPQPLNFNAPQNAALWEPGHTEEIIWGGTGSGQSVDLDLYLSGNFVETIASNLDGTNFSFSWVIPETLAFGETYTIRLTIDNDPLQSIDSDPFTIRTIAPQILSHTPNDLSTTLPPISQVTFSFSEAMDSLSFDIAEDLISFTGPNGSDLSNEVTSVSWNANHTELTIQFNEQTDDGYYGLIVSSQINDLDGHALDHDGDDLFGEIWDDRYAAFFILNAIPENGIQPLWEESMQSAPDMVLGPNWEWGNPGYSAFGGPPASEKVLAYDLDAYYPANLTPRYATTSAFSTLNATAVSLQFDRWLGIAYNQSGSPRNRHADYARIQYSTDGSNWTQLWVNSSQISDTNWTTQNFNLPQSLENQPSVFIRFSIESDGSSQSFGWNLKNIVVSGNVQLVIPPPPAPLVLSHEFIQDENNAIVGIYLTFSQPMDPASFSLITDVAGLNTPSGIFPPSSFVWISAETLRIDFPFQDTPGNYSISIGPDVLDEYGQSLNQDGDALPGEGSDDVYTATFSIPSGLIPSETWRMTFFGTTDNIGDAADLNDFDHDGQSNLLERAFVTDPTDSTSSAPPITFEHASNDFRYSGISYRRIAGGTGTTSLDYTADGIQYSVSANADLGALWSTANISVLSVTANPDGSETVQAYYNVPLVAPDDEKAFLRISVTNVE